jgi:hypothetical protein
LKNIEVCSVPATIDADTDALSLFMDTLQRNGIENQTWQQYQTDDTASFTIAHNGQYLLLKYYVTEKQFNASVRKVNGDVHKDNCVEFFVAYGDAGDYYNIELNCLGSAKVGYGKNKTGRTMLPEEVIKTMIINTSLHLLTTAKQVGLNWTLFVMIPKTLFVFSRIDSFTGLTAKANFYKCGDGLNKPHFLTWTRIGTAKPDFHQPAFFGNILFC